jgi:hypothetical protein
MPYNDKEQPHGYWEVYFFDGDLRFKGYCVNDIRLGYWEYYGNKEHYYAR